MNVSLNAKQTESLSNFFSNMAVAWFVVAFVSPPEPFAFLRFSFYGILAIYISLFLLRKVK